MTSPHHHHYAITIIITIKSIITIRITMWGVGWWGRPRVPPRAWYNHHHRHEHRHSPRHRRHHRYHDSEVKRKSKDSEDDSEAQTSSTRASPDPDAAVTAAKKVADDGTSAGATAGADDGTKAAGNGEEDEDDDDDDGDLMEMPEGGFALVQWCLSLPIYVPLYYLTPQPTSENWTFPIPKFLFCFVISLLWIASFAFLLVWWVEILGEVIGVPDIIMGFTILAAGTSIPDAVSSMAVARRTARATWPCRLPLARTYSTS
ncbi:unnamed protein product [Prorocentrum cordatum]|uniref:Sodium/calcium exchanger membrane region domain-containing protein n=1 Tax=Prorocentrum cordatum TaxID=2364126 RepID=A0ABN9V427_9DINO|nr:unnamed protein product [Polarella glacialis]